MKNEPKWMETARTLIGVKEIAGPQHSKPIMSWLAKLRAWWTDDETPWCGVFVAHVMQANNLPFPKNWMRAKAWSDYGSRLLPERIAPGAILVFERKGGGHVGFYVGEDDLCYHVLGGNQSNMVTISRILKDRCIAVRWPKGQPVIGKPVALKLDGTPMTTNEA